MKEIILTIAAVFFIYTIAQCQVTKKNWIVGGTRSFSSNKVVAANATTDIKSTNASIVSNIGYFIIDNFAVGVNLGIGSNRAKASSIPTSGSIGYSFGPFAKYYFLKNDKPLNFFVNGNYAYRINRTKNSGTIDKSSGYDYSLSGGPVVFFNKSVGLELSAGWYHNKAIEDKVYTNSIKIGIGFQFFLERDKN